MSQSILNALIAILASFTGWISGMVTMYLLIPTQIDLTISDKTYKAIIIISVCAVCAGLTLWLFVREMRIISEHEDHPTYRP